MAAFTTKEVGSSWGRMRMWQSWCSREAFLRMASYPHHYSNGQGNGGQQQPWQDGATDDEDRWVDIWQELNHWVNLHSPSYQRWSQQHQLQGEAKRSAHSCRAETKGRDQERLRHSPGAIAYLSHLGSFPYSDESSTEPGAYMPANGGLRAQSQQGSRSTKEHRLYSGWSMHHDECFWEESDQSFCFQYLRQQKKNQEADLNTLRKEVNISICLISSKRSPSTRWLPCRSWGQITNSWSRRISRWQEI